MSASDEPVSWHGVVDVDMLAGTLVTVTMGRNGVLHLSPREALATEDRAPSYVAGAHDALVATANAWQINGWADVLLPFDRNPIAIAQRVTDWLRARANDATR